MVEKRESLRWSFSIPCECEWNQQTFNTRTQNLSFGGACLSHPVFVPPEGAEVQVTLFTEGATTLRGRVIHSKTVQGELGGIGLFGLQFEEPHGGQSQKLLPIFRACVLADENSPTSGAVGNST